MDYFNYKNDKLWAEDIDISSHINEWGTPCYLYSRATIERHWKAFDSALGKQPHLVCYAVKANSNLAVLNVLAKLGSGFDIVSIGELERVLRAGGRADKIVFSGVGKTEEEMKRALDIGIRCFNVESQAELQLLEQVAKQKGVQAPVSLRVNPDVDAKTHPYISTGLKDNKFTFAPFVQACTAETRPISPDPIMVTLAGGITSTPESKIPFPPCETDNKFAPTWMAILPATSLIAPRIGCDP